MVYATFFVMLIFLYFYNDKVMIMEVVVVYVLFKYLYCLFVVESPFIVKSRYYFLIKSKHIRRNC